jgi:Ca2+/H+ antiporter
MSQLLVFLLVFWSVVLVALIGLFLYRQQIARHEDDFVHLSNPDARVVTEQSAIAQRLDVLDRWMRIGIIVAVVFGVLVLGAYIYDVWNAGLQT